MNKTGDPTFFSGAYDFDFKDMNIQRHNSTMDLLPVLKPFLGHSGQAPAAMRFKTCFTKLKSPPVGNCFLFHSYECFMVSL